jgi:hypothetical protein
MKYTLTLTAEERKALDWVGPRYATGHRLAYLLWVESQQSPQEDWDHDGDITFLVPESVAWAVRELAEEENHRWPCFGPTLAAKMQQFIDSIV